jgi:hypothetical protein
MIQEGLSDRNFQSTKFVDRNISNHGDSLFLEGQTMAWPGH